MGLFVSTLSSLLVSSSTGSEGSLPSVSSVDKMAFVQDCRTWNAFLFTSSANSERGKDQQRYPSSLLNPLRKGQKKKEEEVNKTGKFIYGLS